CMKRGLDKLAVGRSESAMGGGRLAGRVALITGASRGIGAAVARAYAQEGAALALCHEPRPAPAGETEKLAAELRLAGTDVVSLAADLAEPREILDLVTAARSALGPLDVVVNNAAARSNAPWRELSADQWDHVQRVN